MDGNGESDCTAQNEAKESGFAAASSIAGVHAVQRFIDQAAAAVQEVD